MFRTKIVVWKYGMLVFHLRFRLCMCISKYVCLFLFHNHILRRFPFVIGSIIRDVSACTMCITKIVTLFRNCYHPIEIMRKN